MSPGSIVLDYLQANGYADADGGAWPGYVEAMPADPDNAMAVRDTHGKLDGKLMRSGEVIAHPGIQLMIRGADYDETWDKANEIAKFLDETHNAVSGDFVITSLSRSTPLLSLGKEQGRQRFVFSVNWTITYYAA